MEENSKELSLTLLKAIILINLLLITCSLYRLKERVEEIEERQLEVNEYILNKIGG